MIEHCESLAKKYATAFLNLYEHDLSQAIIDNVMTCASFLKQRRDLKAYLTISAIPRQAKLELLEKLCRAFQMPSSFNKLSLTLLEQRRIEFLPKILQAIVTGCKVKQNCINFGVTTSHEISTQEKNDLIQFIQDKVPQKISVNFIIDHSLICGVRIKSNTLMWERSIAKQLKVIKLDALQKVQL